jgi:hypothetical protein
MPLETFMRNIYLDVTCLMDDLHHAVVILRNFCTIALIFSNIRSLYIKMNWDERMVHRDLGTFLADTVSPSLSKLSIQVSLVHKYTIYPLNPSPVHRRLFWSVIISTNGICISPQTGRVGFVVWGMEAPGDGSLHL